MTPWDTLLDVLILLTAALAVGVLLERLRQSAIIGYILAGMVLGPNALQIIKSNQEVDALAELGVALLLFSIGLEFSWRQLKQMGRMVFGGGSLQVVITATLATTAAILCGMDWQGAVAVGAAVALSSTAVVMHVMMRRAELDTRHGRNALAILLFQDIAIVPLVLIVQLLGSENAEATTQQLLRTLGLGGALIVVLFGLFNYVAPFLLGRSIMARNRELPILLALIAAMGSAWGAHAAGLSPAMGAFIAGIMLAASPFATQIRADVGTLRTLLVTLFFSAVGMLTDPLWMIQHAPALLAVVGAIVIGKTVITWAVVKIIDHGHGNAIATGVCLGQVGEFSFVLAMIAHKTVIDDSTFMMLISATIVTMILAPYQVAIAPKLGAWVQRKLSKTRITTDEPVDTDDAKPYVIVVGFGPAGHGVGFALANKPIDVTVIDINQRGVQVAEQMGFNGLIGDATSVEVLEHANIRRANVVVITLPDPVANRHIIELVRTLARSARIVVRARMHVYRWELQLAGADVVVDEEEFVGRRMAAKMREQLRLVTQSDDNTKETAP